MRNDQEKHVELMIDAQLGINNAIQPTSLPKGGYLSKRNAYQNKIGSNTKRPGSAPVTSAALAATIQYLTEYVTGATTSLLAASGTTLYKWDGVTTLTAQTMTNALVSANIYTVAFTDSNLVSILFITDGGVVKKYNGTAVLNIPPAADDASPAPANGLSAINALNPIYTWVYTGHVFVTDGTNVCYYSKLYIFDYFPVTYYQRWVRNNDYITGPGIAYGSVCLIPMRRGWGVLTGITFDTFNGNQFLNTVNGNVSPRAIAKLTYPDGSQTVAYLSDDGVYEVYDTGAIDSSGSGSRIFATRSLMKNKLDFNSYGFLAAEMKAAEAYYDSTLTLYIMTIKCSTTNYAFIYDVRTKEWDLWDNIQAESTVRFNGVLYYAGATKFLHAYDTTLATDYNDYARTTGTVVTWDCYTDLIALEDTGFPSYLDYLLVQAKSYGSTSSIDITVVCYATTISLTNAVQSGYLVWDVGEWDFSVWANLDYTALVNAPPRVKVKQKSFYFQIRFTNPRNELVELYKYQFRGRVSGG